MIKTIKFFEYQRKKTGNFFIHEWRKQNFQNPGKQYEIQAA